MEYGEERDAAVRVDSKQIIAAGVRDQMPSRERKQSERVAVVKRSAVVIETTVGIVGRLEGGDVSFKAPTAARVEVDEPAEAVSDLSQLRTKRRIVLETDRHERVATTQECDIDRPSLRRPIRAGERRQPGRNALLDALPA